LFLCIFIDIFSEWISALMKVVVANGSRKCFGFAFSHSFFNIFLFIFLFFLVSFLWEGCDVFRNKSKFCFFLNLTGHFITFCYCNNWAQGLIFLRKKNELGLTNNKNNNFLYWLGKSYKNGM